MPTYNDYGIVLSNYNYSESDKILNIYTKENGLVKAIAKGVKKSNSRLGGKVTQLSCCFFQFAKGKNLDVITDCSQVNSFALLRSDLNRLTYGILFLEIVRSFAHEMESESIHIYELLYSGLEHLQTINDPDLFSIKFILDFLIVHGFSPQLETCVSCSREVDRSISPQVNYYSCVLGGLLCVECSGFVEYKQISSQVLNIIEGCLHNFQKDSSIKTNHDIASRENIQIALDLLRDHINLRAKSKIKTFDIVFSL